MSRPLRVGLIGFGAIGRSLATRLRERTDVQLVVVSKQTPPTPADLALLPPGTPCVHGEEDFTAVPVDLAVECAGASALRQFAPRVLEQGRDLLVASVGAMADASLEQALRERAEVSKARILIAAGAIGGLDVLSSARELGLEEVNYTGAKPPAAWVGSPLAQASASLADDAVPTLLFEGSAREAALRFPQNANVTAAVAIAGIGFDATRVQLIADATLKGNEHRVNARGGTCSIRLIVQAQALHDNPRSSQLVPCSLLQGIINRRSTIGFA